MKIKTKNKKKIKYPAIMRAHWATGPVDVCMDHAVQIKKLGAIMGCHVHVEKIGPGFECINCVNENKE